MLLVEGRDLSAEPFLQEMRVRRSRADRVYTNLYTQVRAKLPGGVLERGLEIGRRQQVRLAQQNLDGNRRLIEAQDGREILAVERTSGGDENQIGRASC